MFTATDLKQFEEKKISLASIETQISHFRSGFPFIKLSAAATPEKGIEVLDAVQIDKLKEIFEEKASGYAISKMVPASGAASRMFKSLHAFMDGDTEEAQGDIKEFIDKLSDFAFYGDLSEVLKKNNLDINTLLAGKQYKTIIRYLLTDAGLNYTALPKGLLMFHQYAEGARTPLEEHMVEGKEYSKDKNGLVHLHFTVSPEHKEKFVEKASSCESKYVSGNNSFDISYSIQKPSTDTIAVDMNNEPFRNPDGSILFRPGGHGALIENLNEIDADIAFIKNIDNVVPDSLKEPTYTYKKVLGGLLIKLMDKSFEIITAIENGEMNAIAADEAVEFARNEMNIHFPNGINFFSLEDKKGIIIDKLNRPIRICGMVKNEGEPGGGPFWVSDPKGNTSLQVVESSQINMDNEEQKDIVGQATHFNPVDLVCSLKNHKGNNFDLHEFIDSQTGFISLKSKDGKELKAQELPGLWNGAMADWISVFVEVPIETFNPVKTVNDLLRPQHQ